jgi:hypothetical protein
LWFVAIDNVSVGPMSARKVRAHRRVKQVDDASLVWKEGIPDWLPLRDCKKLVGLIAALDIEATTKSVEQGASVVPAPAVYADEVKTTPGGGRALPKNDSEGGFSKAESLEELAFFEEGGSEVDDRLLTMESQVNSIQSLAPRRPDYKNQRTIMFAAVGFFVVAVVTLGFAIFGGEETGEAKTVRTVEKVIEKVVYRDRIIEKEVEVAAVVTEDKSTQQGRKSRNSGGGLKNKPTAEPLKANDARTQELMKRFGLSAPLGSAPSGDKEIEGPGSQKSSSTGALTASQVQSVVNRNKSRLKTCYERALRTGEAPEDRDLRADFKLVVGASGMVKTVTIGGEAAGLISMQRCLTQSVKKWVFPASSDASPVEFPFLFTPR